VKQKILRGLLAVIMLFTLAGCKTTGVAVGPAKVVLREVPREQRTALMILNFKNATLQDRAEKFLPWEFGLASMLMTDLESVGLFNILSRELLKDILREQALHMTGLVDDSKAIEVGRIVAAKYVVTGTFMEMDGSLRIESRLLSVENGAQLGATAVSGMTSNFFDLEKQLLIEMTNFLGVTLDDTEARMLAAQVETKSMDASLSNYAGEIALLEAKEFKATGKPKQADFLLKQARIRFEVALKHDPGYQRARDNLASLTMAIPMTL
jgi:TolB-like protein